MTNILKSIHLDHNILKSHYKVFIAVYAIAVLVGILSQSPAVTVAIVMVISAPFIGTYFSIYEKNNLNKLYGVLPLRKLEVVAGRYLYVILLGIINGMLAGIAAYVLAFFLRSGIGFFDCLTYISVCFLFYCLFIGILFPFYFKFSFSSIYLVINLPIYICTVIGIYISKKTSVLKHSGVIIQYFTSHQYMIWIAGFGLGLLLLLISCFLSYAISNKS